MPAPRSNLSDTLQFAFEVLNLIPSRTHKTAKEIHEELKSNGTDRDLRSVQRILKTLTQAYDQLEVYDAKKPYGYKWGNNKPKLLLPSMTTDEALLLVMAGEYLANYLPQKLQSSMGSYFNEARAVLNSRLSDLSAKAWLDKVQISPPTLRLIPPEIKADVLETVSHCLFNGQELSLHYRDRKGEEAEFFVHPYGLIDRTPTLMLVGNSLKVDQEAERKIRTFSLHRIQQVQEHDFTFEVPEEFDLETYVQEQRHMWGRGELVALSFEVSPRAGSFLHEAKIGEDQKIEICDDEWLRVTATVPESLELRRWLDSFGTDLREEKMTVLNEETASL